MEQTLIQAAVSQGVWCLLFVILFIWTVKENKEREKNYQETITNNQQIITDLANSFKALETVKNDVEDIKVELKRR